MTFFTYGGEVRPLISSPEGQICPIRNSFPRLCRSSEFARGGVYCFPLNVGRCLSHSITYPASHPKCVPLTFRGSYTAYFVLAGMTLIKVQKIRFDRSWKNYPIVSLPLPHLLSFPKLAISLEKWHQHSTSSGLISCIFWLSRWSGLATNSRQGEPEVICY